MHQATIFFCAVAYLLIVSATTRPINNNSSIGENDRLLVNSETPPTESDESQAPLAPTQTASENGDPDPTPESAVIDSVSTDETTIVPDAAIVSEDENQKITEADYQ